MILKSKFKILLSFHPKFLNLHPKKGSTSLQSDDHICLLGVNPTCERVRWLFRVLVFDLNVRWISVGDLND